LGAGIKVQSSELFQLIMSKECILKPKVTNFKIQNGKVDIKLNIIPENIGRILPLNKLLNAVDHIFVHMGFKTVDSPDFEDEFQVFDAVYRLS
jgi:phenylalanyl-tRNA synthetase alpha subunit